MDQVVEQRRGQVQGSDPLGLDEVERRGGVPVGLADEAAAHDLRRQQRVDAHGVVQRHHPEGALAGPVALVQRLRQAAGPLGGVAAGHTLRPAGGTGGVEEDGRLTVIKVVGRRHRTGGLTGGEQAGVGLAGRRTAACPQAIDKSWRGSGARRAHGHEVLHRAAAGLGVLPARLLEDHDDGAGIGDAVGHVGGGDAPRERHDDGAQPLAGPVRLHGLAAVLEHHGHPVVPAHAQRRQPGCQPGGGLLQAAVAEPRIAVDDGVGGVRRALGGVQQRQAEVHADSAAAAMASMMGA